MKTSDRLRFIRKQLNKTQKDFATIFNITQAGYSRIERGEIELTSDKIDLLSEFNVNANWLISGNEKPFTTNSYIQEEKYSASNTTPIISHTKGVPYYDVDFIGGFDVILSDQTSTPTYLIDFEKYNNADCWCNVTGHSMEPAIGHGDIIALKEIVNWQMFLPFGEVYAIVTTEHRTIKKVTGGSNLDNFLLIPENRSEEFQSQKSPKSIIMKIYKVLGCVKKL